MIMSQGLVSLCLHVRLDIVTLALSCIHRHTEVNIFLHQCYKQKTAVITSPWNNPVWQKKQNLKGEQKINHEEGVKCNLGDFKTKRTDWIKMVWECLQQRRRGTQGTWNNSLWNQSENCKGEKNKSTYYIIPFIHV